ncbi:hypothetical protein AKJ29_09580 [Aliiroseovarius crassostreae]|uniref:Transposase n=1 Tax=Aliiroseovarius crassostreae TaxID=154981 RepID=A0A0P7IER3_9RHOB|nr:hypothetical protein AKJ29_09580 [Aliiroseovarius crassostreae]
MLRALSSAPDFKYAMIDGSVVKAHRSGQGAKGDAQPGHRALTRRLPKHLPEIDEVTQTVSQRQYFGGDTA